MSVRERLDAGRATTEDAMELFDSLEPVDEGMKSPFFFILRREHGG